MMNRWLLMVSILLACWLPLRGIPPEREAELEGDIQRELQAKIEDLLGEQYVCETLLGLDYPVPAPSSTLAELKEALDARVDREAQERYPDSQRQVFYREALEKFSLFERGQLVEVERLKGLPIKGRLREIREFDVLIDIRTVRYDEMHPDSLARFRKELSVQRIDRYVRQKMEGWVAKRRDYEEQIHESRETELYTDANYVQVLGEWIPLQDYFQRELAARRAGLADRLRPLLRTKIFMQAGYRFYEGVWLSPQEIQQRKQLLAQKNEFGPEFEAALNRLNDENGESVIGGTQGGGEINPW